MARLECSRSGWGAVRDPETDDYVDLDSDVSEDVADRLTERYPEVTRADSDTDTSEDADADVGADVGELEDEADQDEEQEPDYSSMEYSELRQVAKESDIEGIDGRSSRQEILRALENDTDTDNEED